MSNTAHSIEEFDSLVRPLLGLTVSLPWKGYGTTVFLELGKLTPSLEQGELVPISSKRRYREQGEACIWIDWDWRVECGHSVLFGSSNSLYEIDERLEIFQGSTVQAISLVGQVPELVIDFSDEIRLRSMVMVSGDPEWTLRLQNDDYMFYRDGSLLVGTGEPSELTDADAAAKDLAKKTAARWGLPTSGRKRGECSSCAWFVYLNGNYDLLDYGVCVSGGGPFDGKVVNFRSGCLRFTDVRVPDLRLIE